MNRRWYTILQFSFPFWLGDPSCGRHWVHVPCRSRELRGGQQMAWSFQVCSCQEPIWYVESVFWCHKMIPCIFQIFRILFGCVDSLSHKSLFSISISAVLVIKLSCNTLFTVTVVILKLIFFKQDASLNYTEGTSFCWLVPYKNFAPHLLYSSVVLHLILDANCLIHRWARFTRRTSSGWLRQGLRRAWVGQAQEGRWRTHWRLRRREARGR